MYLEIVPTERWKKERHGDSPDGEMEEENDTEIFPTEVWEKNSTWRWYRWRGGRRNPHENSPAEQAAEQFHTDILPMEWRKKETTRR